MRRSFRISPKLLTKNIRSLVLYLLGAVTLFAAEKNAGILSVYLYDSEKETPVVGAVILIEPHSHYEISDEDGYFHILLDPGKYLLRISHISYRDTEVSVLIEKDEDRKLLIPLENNPHLSEGITVYSENAKSATRNIAEKNNELSGKELQRSIGITLAETMKNKTGIAIRSMGPAPARPVVRGLSGNHLQINQDEMIVADMSATSPDHAVAVESHNVEKIEIIRGPKSVLYTPTTVGGVVNLVKKDIPQRSPDKLFGFAGIYGETINKGMLGTAGLTMPLGKFALNGEFSYKETEDTQSPDSVLENTALQNLNLNFGASYFFHEGYAGIGYNEFQSNYGIPPAPQELGAHPSGVDIELKRREYKAKFHYDFHEAHFNHLNVRLGRTYFQQIEYEKSASIDDVGTEFKVVNYTGNATVDMNVLGLKNNLIIKLDGNYRDFEFGGRYNSAPTNSFMGAVSVYFHKHFGRLSIEAGGRIEYNEHQPEYRPSLEDEIGPYGRRNFNSFTWSLNTAYELLEDMVLGATLSRTSRSPSVEELYSGGPHLAAYSWEIGNPDLKKESGYGFEGFISLIKPRYEFIASGFLNSFDYFIATRATGEIDWSVLLPIYQFEGLDSRFMGYELQIKLIPISFLHLKGNLSYVEADNLSDNMPMPMIPPLKGNGGVELHYDGYTAGLFIESAANQDRVDEFEDPTPGYIIYRAYFQKDITTKRIKHNISLSLENLTNETYYNHLSRIKAIMPEPGMSVKLNYKLYFY